MNMSSPQKTPLYEAHLRQKAHITDFHGWLMPVYYERILKEYEAVRKGVGVFDVSHMGEVIVKGAGAQAFLERLVTADVANMQEGSIRYGLMLNEQGGIVDDLTIYCLNATRDEFQLCVNAGTFPPANIAHIMAIAQESKDVTLSVKDISAQVGLLAVQGADAPKIMEQILGKWVHDLGYYTCRRCDFMGEDALLSRIGYTGEDGYEWAIPASLTEKAWDALLALGVVPCGLGARDVLRLEMGFHLYGNDMDTTTNPIAAKLAWTLRKSGGYLGYEAVMSFKKEGVTRKLTPLISMDKCNPRAGDKVYLNETAAMADQNSLGYLSSGGPSPLLGKGIALSYLPTELSSQTPLYLKSGKRILPLHITQLPFIPRPEKPFLNL